MRNRPGIAGSLAGSTALLLIQWIFLGDALIHPGEFLFGSAGDGLKAYTALAWQLAHGHGVWTELYMHPHGTHILYADVNPLLYGVLALCQNIGWTATPEQVVLLTNLLMLAGMYPALWLLMAIGRKVALPRWYATILAILIVGLSPQWYRLTGHFSMAQFWVVPLLWWCLLHWREHPHKWHPLIWYTLSGLLAAFMHPYFGLLSGAFLLVFLLAGWNHPLRFGGLKIWRKAIVVAVAFIPVVTLSAWTFFTREEVIDAVKVPFGFRFYRAGFESIFVANDGPVREFIDSFLRIRHYNMEGFAYVGLTGFFLLVALLVLWIIRKIRPHIDTPQFWRECPEALKHSVLAGTLILIPAMVIPINWIPFLEDYLGPIRQFRSPGRLAWVFFYLYMMFAGYILHQTIGWFRDRQKAWLGISIACLGAMLWLGEGSLLMRQTGDIILGQARKDVPEWNVNWNEALANNGVEADQFQAMISIPFFFHGTEKIYRGNWYAERYGHVIAMRTGLPMVNNFAARASLSHSREAIQLVSHPIIHRDYPEQLEDQRPFLVVHHRNSFLLPGEQYLLDQAEFLGNQGDFSFLMIRPDQLRASKSFQVELQADSANTCRSNDCNITWEGFGDEPDHAPGIAAQRCDRWNRVVWEGIPQGISPDTEPQPMEISVWIRLDQDSDYLPDLTIRQFDGETAVFTHKMITMNTMDVWGEWAIARDTVSLRSYPTRMETGAKTGTFDRLMIRPPELNVISQTPDHQNLILWNNYPVNQNP